MNHQYTEQDIIAEAKTIVKYHYTLSKFSSVSHIPASTLSYHINSKLQFLDKALYEEACAVLNDHIHKIYKRPSETLIFDLTEFKNCPAIAKEDELYNLIWFFTDDCRNFHTSSRALYNILKRGNINTIEDFKKVDISTLSTLQHVGPEKTRIFAIIKNSL